MSRHCPIACCYCNRKNPRSGRKFNKPRYEYIQNTSIIYSSEYIQNIFKQTYIQNTPHNNQLWIYSKHIQITAIFNSEYIQNIFKYIQLWIYSKDILNKYLTLKLFKTQTNIRAGQKRLSLNVRRFKQGSIPNTKSRRHEIKPWCKPKRFKPKDE